MSARSQRRRSLGAEVFAAIRSPRVDSVKNITPGKISSHGRRVFGTDLASSSNTPTANDTPRKIGSEKLASRTFGTNLTANNTPTVTASPRKLSSEQLSSRRRSFGTSLSLTASNTPTKGYTPKKVGSEKKRPCLNGPDLAAASLIFKDVVAESCKRRSEKTHKNLQSTFLVNGMETVSAGVKVLEDAEEVTSVAKTVRLRRKTAIPERKSKQEHPNKMIGTSNQNPDMPKALKLGKIAKATWIAKAKISNAMNRDRHANQSKSTARGGVKAAEKARLNFRMDRMTRQQKRKFGVTTRVSQGQFFRNRISNKHFRLALGPSNMKGFERARTLGPSKKPGFNKFSSLTSSSQSA